MPTKRFAWSVVALAAVAAAIWYRSQVFREPATPVVHIALVTGGSGPYWQLIANGAREAATEHHVDLQVKMPAADENVDQQTALLEGLNLERVDGVAISPLDAEQQTPMIDRIAKDASVITFDADAPDSARLSYVGTSNVQAGRRAARLVQEAIPAGGKIVVVMANLTKDNMIERRSGFEEIIGQPVAAAEGESTAPTYEVVDYLVDEGSKQRSRELLKQSLADHVDLACLVGMNAQHGAILLSVLEDEEKLGKIAVVAFDEEQPTLAGVEAGTIYATVVQDPFRYGYESVRSLAAMCRGGKQQRPMTGSFSTYSIATMSVTKDTLPEFRRQLAQRLESE